MYKTTAAYVSGGICGDMWWPCALAGKTVSKNLRGPWGIMQDGWSFRDALDSLLMAEGGDFRNAQFTADTVIRIERRRVDGPYKYSIHVKEIEVAALVPNMTNDDAFTGDFFGED